MLTDAFLQKFQQSFPHELTAEQEDAVRSICHFVYDTNRLSLFILRGYAGTGKTVLVSALVNTLKKINLPTVLLAPTGRAAKVFAQAAGVPAYTVHKQIYRQHNLADEDSHFDLDRNTFKHALFIVDESSMIAAQTDPNARFGSGSLLKDLLHYVYRSEGCRLLMVGDDAQLPPVGEDWSYALQGDVYRNLGLSVTEKTLTQVHRQASESGILTNATQLREQIREQDVWTPPVLQVSPFRDIRVLGGDEILDTLQSAYDRYGTEGTIVLTRSNKQAQQYNQGIRTTFFDREDDLQRGDIVMVVRNNYYWTEQWAHQRKEAGDSTPLPMDFIANGDMAEVVRVRRRMEFYGLHFADVVLSFPDYDHFEAEARILLDALTTDTPSLTAEQSQALYQGVMEDHADASSRKEQIKQVRQDPNYNALQIKYAYAVTCHKAQGGQWHHVFVDQGWLPPDSIDLSYYRWLYTAFTRPTHKLFLINWPKENVE